jgi:hypothetical protein
MSLLSDFQSVPGNDIRPGCPPAVAYYRAAPDVEQRSRLLLSPHKLQSIAVFCNRYYFCGKSAV